MKLLLNNIKNCLVCQDNLPFLPNPVVHASSESRILIIGQAPGLKVQQTGKPWDDLSGKELRRWLGVDETLFYNEASFALVPMGFCYPGKGKSGDLPPRKECAPLWHPPLLEEMKKLRLTLLVGSYAQAYYLGKRSKPTLTENVRFFSEFLPAYLPLVHPSPRNKIWQKKNPWFEKELIPQLQEIVKKILR